MRPSGFLSLRIAKKSSVELSMYFVGRYGVIILFICLATVWVGVGIWEIMGRRGLLALWFLTVPYK